MKDVHVFDLYEGEKMEARQKSVAFSITYFDPERTLTDEEVANAHSRVLKAVEEKFGAELRRIIKTAAGIFPAVFLLEWLLKDVGKSIFYVESLIN